MSFIITCHVKKCLCMSLLNILWLEPQIYRTFCTSSIKFKPPNFDCIYLCRPVSLSDHPSIHSLKLMLKCNLSICLSILSDVYFQHKRVSSFCWPFYHFSQYIVLIKTSLISIIKYITSVGFIKEKSG